MSDPRRLRIMFTKTGKVRWTSHRDLARMWERAIRRVGLPVAYSEGFSPRPKLHFGLALSTGHESVAEYLDVDLMSEPDADLATEIGLLDLPARLTPALPVGIEALVAAEIDRRTPSLQQAVTSCTWRVEVRGIDPDTLAAATTRALAAPTLVLTRQRKGHDVTDDVRPYLLDLAVVGPTEAGAELQAHLATQPRGLRVAELLTVLARRPEDGDRGPVADGPGEEPGEAWQEGRVRRTHQWTQLDGARSEPMALLGATSAPHAEARAS
ncbi:MAG TPA: TIGR03936 family radical SAM-associated protein [Acidimicrobiales bacterium]|jgi:radical SAM-linked protein